MEKNILRTSGLVGSSHRLKKKSKNKEQNKKQTKKSSEKRKS